jgi:hypothetical protein
MLLGKNVVGQMRGKNVVGQMRAAAGLKTDTSYCMAFRFGFSTICLLEQTLVLPRPDLGLASGPGAIAAHQPYASTSYMLTKHMHHPATCSPTIYINQLHAHIFTPAPPSVSTSIAVNKAYALLTLCHLVGRHFGWQQAALPRLIWP